MHERKDRLGCWCGVFSTSLSFACLVACASQTSGPAASGAASPSAQAAAPADPATQGVVDRRGKAGASIFVAHQVTDFEAFKKFFEDGSPERDRAGVKGHVVTRLDDGRVVVHLFGGDLDALKMTFESPQVRQYLDRTGGPDRSFAWLAYDELVKLPATPPSGQTFSLFVRLRMLDLAPLRRGFVDLQPLFTDHRVVASGLHHSVDQSDLVFLHLVGTDRGKLEALTKRPEFIAWLDTRGTTEPPQTFLGEDVSRSRTYFAGFQ